MPAADGQHNGGNAQGEDGEVEREGDEKRHRRATISQHVRHDVQDEHEKPDADAVQDVRLAVEASLIGEEYRAEILGLRRAPAPIGRLIRIRRLLPSAIAGLLLPSSKAGLLLSTNAGRRRERGRTLLRGVLPCTIGAALLRGRWGGRRGSGLFQGDDLRPASRTEARAVGELFAAVSTE